MVMKNIYILLIIGLISVSCARKQEEKIETKPQDLAEELIPSQGYRQPDISKDTSKMREPRIEALFTINKDVLNLSDLNKVTSIFDVISPYIFRMIEASGGQQQKLEKEANKIVQGYGYKDLRDYGEHLEVYTWAAGTFLKLQSVDQALAIDSQSRISDVLEQSLKNRIKRQPLSTRDIELIRSNWYKIDKVLKTMEEMSASADKIDQQKYR